MKIIRHYASQYYDPAKAHEYYMRTRQLKGRTTSGMSQEQREAWKYAKDQITTEKKAKFKEMSETQKQSIEMLRKQAKETREKIVEKLKALKQKSEPERKKIAAELKAAISKVRDQFKQTREAAKVEYEGKYQTEYDNIMANVPGKVAKRKKRR